MGRTKEIFNRVRQIPKILKVFLVLLLVPSIFILLVSFGAFGPIPGRQALASLEIPAATQVLDVEGEALGKFFIEERTEIPYEQLSPHLVLALLATEDVRFFDHGGIDVSSFGRVFFRTILMGDASAGGGSTLTQQLAKNLFPRKDHGILTLPVNKVREMIIARRLERMYSKEELLAFYLNTVGFGENAYGIASASRRFFNTRPDSLSYLQSALLVGMLKGPTFYSPVRHPDRAKERRDVVLEQMERYGYLEGHQVDSLKRFPLGLRYTFQSHHDGVAPYFREYIRTYLDKWCKSVTKPNGEPYNLYTDGLIIHTTLDKTLQDYAEAAVAEHMPQLQKKLERMTRELSAQGEVVQHALERVPAYQAWKKKGFDKATLDSLLWVERSRKVFSWTQEEQEALSLLDSVRRVQRLLHTGFVAMDPVSGHVRAWVGGIDHHYFQYDHVLASRQTGSAFKPIVYAAALKSGEKPCNYTSNDRQLYGDTGDWTPKNSDRDYGGEYSMEGGLTYSVNIVAVNTLRKMGYPYVIQFARDLGIKAELPQVPSLALGVADISLLEMTAAFAAITNGGTQVVPKFVSRIEDRTGRILWKSDSSAGPRILPETASLMMVEMLQNVVHRGTGASLKRTYKLKGDMAGKTGTSQDQSDGWFLGATPHLVGGAWVGADDRRVHFPTLREGQGARTALPIWGLFMQKVQQNPKYATWKSASFPEPSFAVKRALNCPMRTNIASQSEFQKWWEQQKLQEGVP